MVKRIEPRFRLKAVLLPESSSPIDIAPMLPNVLRVDVACADPTISRHFVMRAPLCPLVVMYVVMHVVESARVVLFVPRSLHGGARGLDHSSSRLILLVRDVFRC